MAIRKIGYSGSPVSLTTTYASAELTSDRNWYTGLIGLGTLWLFLENLATAATATVKLSRDAAGDELIAPPYAATIYTGETDATDATVVVDFDNVPWIGSNNIYVWVVLDAGTADLVSADMTYRTQ